MHNQITELHQLAAQIESRRETLNLSKTKLVAGYVQLGSSKTYNRMLDPKDDLEGFDLGKQLDNYRAALELLTNFSGDADDNIIYGDFDFMKSAMSDLAETLKQTDNTRLMLLTAETGGGKSSFLDWLETEPRFRNLLYRVEADETWRGKSTPLVARLLEAVRIDRSSDEESTGADGESQPVKRKSSPLPIGGPALLERLVETIGNRRIVLGIDEGHHIGPEGYNIVKTIINRTRAVVLLTAIPALMDRINKFSHEEAKQLFFNRLYTHYRLPDPGAGNVLEYMTRRGVTFASEADKTRIVGKITEDAKIYGLWKYVKRITIKARERNKPLDIAGATEIIGRIKNKIALAK